MDQDTYRSDRALAARHLQQHKYQEAIPALEKLLGIDRQDCDAWLMLAAANAGLRQYGNVAECCRQAIAIQPDNAAAHYNLGMALLQQGHADDAAPCLRKASTLAPERPDVHFQLGNALFRLRQFDEAAGCYRRVLELNPGHAMTYNSLGAVLLNGRNFSGAIQACLEAIRLRPDYAEAYTNLGSALGETGQYTRAIENHQRAIALNPELASARYNLGNALAAVNRFTEAVTHYEEALRIDPVSADVHGNLANALGFAGEIRRALTVYRQALEIHPGDVVAHSGLLHSMIYDPDSTPEQIYAEHVNWNRLHCRDLPVTRNHTNSPDPERPLRIGYVSPDFRNHSVAWFIEPVLENHDRSSFETFCYYNNHTSDNTTERLRELSGNWRDVAGLTDEGFARTVRDDAIDILVDLAGHTSGNRLAAFARKPAPVQATWLGYPCTTGLDAMDYRITDEHADPPASGRLYSETLYRLPERFICYKAPADSPSVGPLPALETGRVTFGSFNMLSKLSPEVIELWASILRDVDESGLILKNNSFGDPGVTRRYLEMFRQHGIAESRIELIPWKPGLREHLELYNRVDIALDTFPYNGTTTSFEALWMGVPVVTLVGVQHAGRVGLSILNNLGLHELAATTKEDYPGIARQLALDTNRLEALRSGLRSRLQSSSLCDGTGFTRNLEAAFRMMWKKWCARK